MSHQFHASFLREYDCRGIVGDTLNAEDATALGQAFGSILKRQGGQTIAVGMDGRLSSPMLSEALIKGLVSVGLDVKDVGMGPTPMLYFAARSRDYDAGIMITGSHNPPDYNGFKIMTGKKPFWGPDIQALGPLAAKGDFETGEGSVEVIDVIDDYVDELLKAFRGREDLKVAWDAGNGAAGIVLQKMTAKLPGEHILLFEDVDGTFPNHHPDPTVEKNLADLKAAVLEHGCDAGIGFDGDGDRVGAVDSQARVLWGDQILAVLSRETLADHPGSVIISDVKASQVLFDEIARLGGEPLMWKTGHSPIKEKMAETNSPLAGEMSGHIFFADRYYGYDDAPYAGLRLLNAIGGEGESLADLKDALPVTVTTPETRFDVPEERKFAIIEEIVTRVKAAQPDVNDMDGVRVNTPDGWWLLRASNTQNVLVARCEAKDNEGLVRLKAAVVSELRASGLDGDVF